MQKLVVFVFGLFLSFNASAAGYSAWAVPKDVELVSGGVLVSGAFGDPNNCGIADYFFVSETDTRFDTVVSMALAALMAKKEIRFYSSKCTSVGFHWAGNVINLNQNGEALYIH